MIRVFHWVMTAVFLFAVVVQFNDPDPLIWIAIYAAAGAVAMMAAIRGRAPRGAALAVGIVAVVWGVVLALGVPGLDVYTYMFDAWEMKSAPIERAREASGLFIAAAWMALLAFRAK